jgi:hypothetical protein
MAIPVIHQVEAGAHRLSRARAGTLLAHQRLLM